MELRQIRYFLAVAEELHFTRAAARLHVAQPALSQQIRQLEKEIGARLFERTNRRVALTPAGDAFRSRAALALTQASRALVEAGQIGRGEAGIISIGFVSSAVCGILPEVLKTFRQSVPLAEIELRELEPSEQLEGIRQRNLDIGLMHATLPEAEFSSLVVSRDRLVAAIPESHAGAARSQIDLRDWAGETFFMPKRHAHPGFHELALSACQQAGFIPARVQPTRLLQTAVALVAGELGITLVPESFQRNLHIRGVVYRPLTQPSPTAELSAVWRSDNRAPLFRKFRQELRRCVSPSLPDVGATANL